MIEAYQKVFGEYPFKKDGYKLIEVPYSGMEHQSAVTYGNRFANGYLERDWTGVGVSPKFDFIIIHESAHEWFGNSVSAADVSDMWIQEGWTTYLEVVYVEDSVRQGRRAEVHQRLQVEGAEPRADHHRARHPPLAVAGPVLQGRAVPAHAAQRHRRRQEVVRAAADAVSGVQVPQHHDRGHGARSSTPGPAQNWTPVFDQYLRHVALPTLELAFDGSGSVSYRWKADVKEFAMPIKVGAAGAWQTIRPTAEWQKMATPLGKDAFGVATDLFYVTVEKK